MSDRPVGKMSFEEAMAELETVVARLETGETALEESIALYERGAKLKAHCEARLKAAEEKVAAIIPDETGQASRTRPFAEAAEDPRQAQAEREAPRTGDDEIPF